MADWTHALAKQIAGSTAILVLLVPVAESAAGIQVNWTAALTANVVVAVLVVRRRFAKHQNGD
jgi:hypothetical protein